ncbi:MAG: GNAT family N-acetyltransferase [Methylococcaceae bacterium]|nr:GNAT family N-acetyltransferase [Methylococcaceae bacterium]
MTFTLTKTQKALQKEITQLPHLQYDSIKANTKFITQILIGKSQLQRQASSFEYIFNRLETPVAGRWASLLIWMETHTDYEPWGILVKKNGHIVASVVLTRYRRFGIWRIGRPIGPCADSVGFAALDEHAAEMLAQTIWNTVESFGGPWCMEIHDLLCPDSVVDYLVKIRTPCKTVLTEPVPHLIFKSGASLKNYLSQNTRAVIIKAHHRIQREGIQMVEEWIRDPEQILKLLPKIQEICRQRDYQKFKKSLMDDTNEESYYIAFMKEYIQQNLIDLLCIYLNGELAAFALCLLMNNEYLVLTNRTSPKWLRYSPGTIANAEVVRHAFESSHINGINWGGGLLRYKLSGDVTLIPRQSLYVWSSPTVRLILILVRYVKYFLQRIHILIRKGFLAIRPNLIAPSLSETP